MLHHPIQFTTMEGKSHQVQGSPIQKGYLGDDVLGNDDDNSYVYVHGIWFDVEFLKFLNAQFELDHQNHSTKGKGINFEVKQKAGGEKKRRVTEAMIDGHKSCGVDLELKLSPPSPISWPSKASPSQVSKDPKGINRENNLFLDKLCGNSAKRLRIN
ncbi:hypothetical protein RIF29_22454 [Crotalaria pallida]|uniref:Uncharacterized protein n=1 Tax=Crotalaria pallida TaxID=3830 RepID=A0AAN9F725_CROPI